MPHLPNPSANHRSLARLCGQLVVGGFVGTTLPETFIHALIDGERGGAILFTRNLTSDPMQCAELTRVIAANSSIELPPLVAIDQEGGRVARLRAPVLELPPMLAFSRGVHPDRSREPEARAAALRLAHDVARALGAQLSALGITMNFAPVLDVNTRADNPVIGDRAFGDDPRVVAELGLTWASGLREGGVMACGKHFPGHGNTAKDSHFDLPVVDRALPGDLDEDVYPFRRVGPSIAAFMTAHVVYPSIDPGLPATLSPKALALARECLGRTGCILSDDLEMKAVADRWSIEESAVRAIEAGCDALLVCRSEELQERAVAALAERARGDSAFRARVQDAHTRFVAMRREVIPQPVRTRADFDAASEAARAIEPRIAPLFLPVPGDGAR